MIYYVKIDREEETIVVTSEKPEKPDYVTDSFDDAMQEARCYVAGYRVFDIDMVIVVKINACYNGK